MLKLYSITNISWSHRVRLGVHSLAPGTPNLMALDENEIPAILKAGFRVQEVQATSVLPPLTHRGVRPQPTVHITSPVQEAPPRISPPRQLVQSANLNLRNNNPEKETPKFGPPGGFNGPARNS